MDVGEIIAVTLVVVIFVLWVLSGCWRKGGVTPDDGVVPGGGDHGDDSNGGILKAEVMVEMIISKAEVMVKMMVGILKARWRSWW